jgi:hypothetical protein
VKRVALVIPDAGPMISLGVGKSLHLLLKLDLPIYLVDVVYDEVTLDQNKPGAREIRNFVMRHPGIVHVAETEIGRIIKEKRSSDRNYRFPHAGETAIGNFFAKIDEIIDPTESVLIVFEDTKIRRRAGLLQDNIHFISTAALLLGMEKVGPIQSADAIWKAMQAAGRTPLKEVIEIAAPRGSRWLPQP